MKAINEHELRDLYKNKQKTLRDIAEHFNCCVATISRKLKKMKLSRIKLSGVKDITGKRFNRLIALHYVKNDKFGKAIWLCRCDCGKEKNINSSAMLAGLTTSCGCYKKDRLSTGFELISGSYWKKLKKAPFKEV